MASSFSKVTILRLHEPRIMISASLLTNPPASPKTLVTRSETILRDLNVGTIVNTAIDVTVLPHHQRMYTKLGIRHHMIPIDDAIDGVPTQEFIEAVLKVYADHDKSRAFLLNCAMGVNRSALGGGAVLWATSNPRPWKTPEAMIDYMRRVQREDRGVYLLTNTTFERDLLQWCRGGGGQESNTHPLEPRPQITLK